MADPIKPDPAASSPAASLSARVGKDLWPRVMSGLVLAAIVATATWFGGYPFALMILIVGAVLAWEWGRIVRGVDIDVVMAAHIGAVVAAVVLAIMDLIGLSMLALLIGAILVALLTLGRHPALSAAGVAFAGLPAVALIWFRADPGYGLAAVGFIIATVVATDVGAYFSGRLIGGPKLWPAVSPNKTWAGLIGAVVTSALLAMAISRFVAGSNPGKLAFLAGILAVVAQAGDLAESALKRRFGAKDASNIIPGHGGFMDRCDGLTTAAIFAAIFAAVLNVQAPAKALLLW